jgi:microcompartment protein CcmK/EutM
MAEKKISELTAKGATVADTDLMVISEVSGASYVTKRVTGANVKALVTDANMTTSDITTNDVSTAKHGFAPKAPNDTTKFLRGDGTWAVPASGGLTEFTEAENTSTPNATVPVNSLTPVTAATNADFAIVPKGNGALLADIPDNLGAGGNKRGAYATDWSRIRSNFDPAAVASGTNSTVSGGENNRASGSNSTVIGGINNISSNSASISGGTASTASGDTSVALGNASASGQYSTAIGYQNGSSGTSATSLGRANTSSGTASFSAGQSNTASGNYSVALGEFNTANGSYSNAQGYQSHVFGIYGRQSYASGQESTAGDSQASKFILRERTTNDTATTLTSDSAGAGTTNQVILSNQSAYRFKGSIVGKQSGSVNAAVWDIDGFIVRGANAAATTLNVSNVTLVQNTPAWGTPTLAADTTNGGLRVQVTGASATNIQWTAVIETTEVIYA